MKKFRFLKHVAVLFFALGLIALPRFVNASDHLDQIHDYSIWVDINDDATVNIKYDITWEVLDSEKEGPLTWVKVGIPNNHYLSYEMLSDNGDLEIIDNGETFARIDFNDKYVAGDVVNFSFSITTDYMYLIGEDDFSTYSFTPGWFDDIDVDQMNIYWKNDKVDHFSPAAFVENGYIHWQEPLYAGSKYTVDVVYPLDAYAFNVETSNAHRDEDKITFAGVIGTIFGIIFVVLLLGGMFALPFVLPAIIIYLIGRGFSGTKKITRTIIEYYPSCPNCGGNRDLKKNPDKCAYCGGDMIKSKRVVEEDKVREEDKDILKYKTNGRYTYTSDPNLVCLVNVKRVPPPPTSTRPSGGHSSCAHSSCACACACACAGGGRAGCTTKDFYNTKLKTKWFKK